jgi:hypothetical protein
MQGAISGVRKLSSGVGPIIFGVLLDVFLYNKAIPEQWKGAPFLMCACLVIIALFVAMTLPPCVETTNAKHSMDTDARMKLLPEDSEDHHDAA